MQNESVKMDKKALAKMDKKAAKAEKKAEKMEAKAQKFYKRRSNIIDAASLAIDKADEAHKAWKNSSLHKLPKTVTHMTGDLTAMSEIENDAAILRDLFKATEHSMGQAKKAFKALARKTAKRVTKMTKKAAKAQAKTAAN